MKVAPPVTTQCKDTIEALNKLLDQARAGEITGFIYHVKYQDREASGVTGIYTRMHSLMRPALEIAREYRKGRPALKITAIPAQSQTANH